MNFQEPQLQRFQVVIVGRTRMKTGLCIGAICEQTGRRLRLIPPHQHNQPIDCPYQVGQRWQLDCRPKPQPNGPHTEDVWVYAHTPLPNDVALLPFITQNNLIDWKGPIQQTFGGGLQLSPNGKCFFPADTPPRQSTGFWQTESPIIKGMRRGKHHYMCFDFPKLAILPFAGEGTPHIYIPPLSIVRLSLSRLFTATEPQFQGYYLQFSGWIGKWPELSQTA